MRLFSKETLNNTWFWVSVGIFVSMCATQLVLEICRERESASAEYTSRCPDGFITWENTEFEITNKFEENGDSLVDFEKRIESGCRPFDFTGIPRATVDSMLAAQNVIHYTWVQGVMNRSKGTVLRADTTHSTKPYKYR